MEWVMKMSRFQITEEEYQRIKEAEGRTRDKRISRNLRVLMLRYEGIKVREIARAMGIQINSVSRICTRYREQGLTEFARNKYTSHCRLLSEEEERAVLEPFEKRAQAGQMITVKEIKAAFDKACGKDTGKVYVYLVLKRHNWRKVMPRPKHPKAADEEACEASKKLKQSSWRPQQPKPITE